MKEKVLYAIKNSYVVNDYYVDACFSSEDTSDEDNVSSIIDDGWTWDVGYSDEFVKREYVTLSETDWNYAKSEYLKSSDFCEEITLSYKIKHFEKWCKEHKFMVVAKFINAIYNGFARELKTVKEMFNDIDGMLSNLREEDRKE